MIRSSVPEVLWNVSILTISKITIGLCIKPLAHLLGVLDSYGVMFVVAMEAFPPVTMPALYGFYVNKIYHLDIPVYELFSLEEKERNTLLDRQAEGVMWMPNCTEEKLQKLSLKWKNRSIYVTEQIGLVCFLEIGQEKPS